MRAFREFCHREIAADVKGPVPAVAEFGVDSELADAESVALVYDEEDGLGYYVESGLVEKAFTDPSLLRRRLYRERVIDYLDDDSVPPHVFRRLSARDAARAPRRCFGRYCAGPGSTGHATGKHCCGSARSGTSCGRPARR